MTVGNNDQTSTAPRSSLPAGSPRVHVETAFLGRLSPVACPLGKPPGNAVRTALTASPAACTRTHRPENQQVWFQTMIPMFTLPCRLPCSRGSLVFDAL